MLARRGLRVAIMDADAEPMMRASQVNQARVPTPRSLTTALSSVHYYAQFVRLPDRRVQLRRRAIASRGNASECDASGRA